jgi:hypothetical protein
MLPMRSPVLELLTTVIIDEMIYLGFAFNPLQTCQQGMGEMEWEWELLIVEAGWRAHGEFILLPYYFGVWKLSYKLKK